MSPRRNCDSPNPSFASAEPGGEGAHSPAGEGLAEAQFRRLEKRLSTLPTLWTEWGNWTPRELPVRGTTSPHSHPHLFLKLFSVI